MPIFVSRTQLSLYVPEPVKSQLEAVRSHLDPVQSALIPAHVTLCREDELALVGIYNLKSILKCLRVDPITLKFGPPEPFQGHGILLPCIAGEGEFRTLRQHVLGSKIVRDQTPHITLAHPRNPKSPNNLLRNAATILSGLTITFSRVQLIEQEGSAPWQVREEYGLMDGLPDISPAALGRLVAGMTTDQVEAIVGRFLRSNLHEGRPFFAWIGKGGMLRACFNGPGGTLSSAILDVPEEQRSLALGENLRRRIKQATIKQKWYCVPCRKRYLQPQSVKAVLCATCNVECERVTLGIRVPSPTYPKAWDRFWAQYLAEKELLDAYARGEILKPVKLELFDLHLPKRRRKKRSS